MSAKRPVFDYAICMACGACDQACPLSCISLTKNSIDAYKNAYPVLGSEPVCTGCGICQKACPVEAIRMTEGAA